MLKQRAFTSRCRVVAEPLPSLCRASSAVSCDRRRTGRVDESDGCNGSPERREPAKKIRFEQMRQHRSQVARDERSVAAVTQHQFVK